MVVIDCAVWVREDGTVEATPRPETVRVEARRRYPEVKVVVQRSAS